MMRDLLQRRLRRHEAIVMTVAMARNYVSAILHREEYKSMMLDSEKKPVPSEYEGEMFQHGLEKIVAMLETEVSYHFCSGLEGSHFQQYFLLDSKKRGHAQGVLPMILMRKKCQ